MTRLLVSVRDVDEARTALAAGVDLIDLKEPRRGSLGRVDDATAAEVAEFLAGRAPLSMALGELVEYYSIDESLRPERPLPPIPKSVSYVKVGLAECARRSHWSSHLGSIVRMLPATVGFVAVVYVDVTEAQSPAVGNILERALAFSARAVLVDTFHKRGRGLFDWWTDETLRRFAADVRSRGMLCVAGGGLTLETIPAVVACGVDYVAVRGAACSGDRTGTIDAERIGRIRALLAAP